MKILVFPDIHGRHFWERPAKELLGSCDAAVFLGDYFDPYGMEHDPFKKTVINGKKELGAPLMPDDDMMENFRNILKLKDSKPEKVTLLLGNHDLHYLTPRLLKRVGDCRLSYKQYDEIHEALTGNFSKFSFAKSFECSSAGKKYTLLFTHAGVNKDWFEKYSVRPASDENEQKPRFSMRYKQPRKPRDYWFEGVGPEGLADKINEGLKDLDGDLTYDLCDNGWMRGGYDQYGGPFWSDVDETCIPDGSDWTPFGDDLFQIFGHSQQTRCPVIRPHCACCDVRRSFVFDADLKRLFEIDGTPARNENFENAEDE